MRRFKNDFDNNRDRGDISSGTGNYNDYDAYEHEDSYREAYQAGYEAGYDDAESGEAYDDDHSYSYTETYGAYNDNINDKWDEGDAYDNNDQRQTAHRGGQATHAGRPFSGRSNNGPDSRREFRDRNKTQTGRVSERSSGASYGSRRGGYGSKSNSR